jgi:hypothetical protein
MARLRFIPPKQRKLGVGYGLRAVSHTDGYGPAWNGWQGKARQGTARRGLEGSGAVRLEWRGKEWPGRARQGPARQGKVGCGWCGWCGPVRCGLVR